MHRGHELREGLALGARSVYVSAYGERNAETCPLILRCPAPVNDVNEPGIHPEMLAFESVELERNSTAKTQGAAPLGTGPPGPTWTYDWTTRPEE